IFGRRVDVVIREHEKPVAHPRVLVDDDLLLARAVAARRVGVQVPAEPSPAGQVGVGVFELRHEGIVPETMPDGETELQSHRQERRERQERQGRETQTEIEIRILYFLALLVFSALLAVILAPNGKSRKQLEMRVCLGALMSKVFRTAIIGI